VSLIRRRLIQEGGNEIDVGETGVYGTKRRTSSESSLSSSCHFDLAAGFGATIGAAGVEVPEVGSSMSVCL
jgi:hypothetical protein